MTTDVHSFLHSDPQVNVRDVGLEVNAINKQGDYKTFVSGISGSKAQVIHRFRILTLEH